MSLEHSAELLQIKERLRNHWSRIINNLLGFTIVALAAIGAFFGQSYITHAGHPEKTVLFFYLAAAASALILGLWRLYSRYIDNQVAQLYPEIFLYETNLGVAPSYGIWGYLSRNIPILSNSVSINNLEATERVELLRQLADRKRLGTRGHLAIDIPVLLSIILLIGFAFRLLCLYYAEYLSKYDKEYFGLPYCLMFTGLILVIMAMRKYQRKPSAADIEQAVNAIQRKT